MENPAAGSKRPRPDVQTYTTMIDIYGKNGRVDEAVRLFKVPFSSASASATIVVHTDRLRGAWQLLETSENSRPPPNVLTYTTMIDIYGKHGRLDDAFALFQKMQRGENGNTTATATATATVTDCWFCWHRCAGPDD